MTSAPRRRRSIAVAAPLLVALALSGCGSDNDDQDIAQGICRDPVTDLRVDDDLCGDSDGGNGGFTWIYFGGGSSGRSYPAVGQKVSSFNGGTTTAPAGTRAVKGGAPVAGGSVAKSSGGFGKSSVSKGGGGTGG